jgi:D-alanyl-D-alanine carboxypeptidase/D-alanyl-D-alanine-endopeptidase (penicillin-binding protein 4)
MANDFSMDRLKKIFPTPTQGTLWAYQKADSNYLFAKTGTLSGVVALSGFLYTNKGRFMIFSILVNNHRTSSTEVRKRIQGFLAFIRGRY